MATVTITGTSGSLTHTTNVALTVVGAPDYSLSASPVSVPQGASAASTVTVIDLNNFNGAVNLSASSLPAGVTASFTSGTTSGSTQLILTASGNAPTGSANIVVTGVSGNLTHSTAVPLTIVVPDYSLSSSPVTVSQGSTGTSAIAVTDINGFSGAVNLTASGLPFGVSASFSPASTTGSSALTLKALSYATIGPATITITGVSGGLVHTTTVALTVTPPPDFSLSISTMRFNIPKGRSVGGTITVTGINGFDSSVALTVTGLPAGVTASVNPPSTASAGSVTLTVAPTTAVGTDGTVTITGQSGGKAHAIFVSLLVTSATN